MLPAIECGCPELRLASGERCTKSPAEPLQSAPTKFECAALVADSSYRARLETELRAPSKTTPGIALGFHDNPLLPGNSKLFELFVPGSALTPDFAAHSKALNLAPINPIVNFMVSNEGDVPIDLRHTRFVAERDRTIVELVGSESTLKNVELAAQTLTLSAPVGGEESKAERRFSWPRAEATSAAFLELEARAPAGADSGQLVIDLYDESGFDPEAAQLVVLAKDLGREFKLLSKPIAVSDLPESLSLRVFAEGGAKAEVRKARLVARSEQLLSGFPVTRGPLQQNLKANGDSLQLGARGWVAGRLYMPVRPLEIRLYASAPAPARGNVEFGFHAAGMPLDDFQRRRVEPDELAGPWPLKKTALIAPDVREGTLFVRGSEAAALRVQRLEVRDACALRQYQNPKAMANGLLLYENPRALPRAYTADRVVAAGDFEVGSPHVARVRRVRARQHGGARRAALFVFDERQSGVGDLRRHHQRSRGEERSRPDAARHQRPLCSGMDRVDRRLGDADPARQRNRARRGRAAGPASRAIRLRRPASRVVGRRVRGSGSAASGARVRRVFNARSTRANS